MAGVHTPSQIPRRPPPLGIPDLYNSILDLFVRFSLSLSLGLALPLSVLHLDTTLTTPDRRHGRQLHGALAAIRKAASLIPITLE